MSWALENGRQNYQVGIGNPKLTPRQLKSVTVIGSFIPKEKKSVGNHFETNGSKVSRLYTYTTGGDLVLVSCTLRKVEPELP